MKLDHQHILLKTLAIQGVSILRENQHALFGQHIGGVAYHDKRKDELITSLETFNPAVQALSEIPKVQLRLGASEGRRLALQFIYNTCEYLEAHSDVEAAFEQVWIDFINEIETPTWCFRDLANIQNIECSENAVEIIDGISIRSRSFEELAALLKWGPRELSNLASDWAAGAMSSFVLLIERYIPKTPKNLILSVDGTGYQNAVRVLLAMRLLAPGDLRIGKTFHTRPAAFNVGIGGRASTGFSFWLPGSPYVLTMEHVPAIKQLYGELQSLEGQKDKTTRTLNLALRSFSSIYDRLFHQAEDRVVDAITALEALWQLDAELSFKLAFRTAALLSTTDDERVATFVTLNEYYKIRSKLVHGGSLSLEQEGKIHNDEPLRAIVRRALRAFVYLSTHSGEWSVKRLYEEADVALLHSAELAKVQVAMGITL